MQVSFILILDCSSTGCVLNAWAHTAHFETKLFIEKVNNIMLGCGRAQHRPLWL